MINYTEQETLFTLIANKLKQNVSCYAFGGTAMMYYGYKDETKDIDVVFESADEHAAFIEAIKSIGFKETSPIQIYVPEKLQDKTKPIMFSFEDYRIDVFLKYIFRTALNQKIKNDMYAVHEYKGKKTLTLKVMKKEHIVQLKAITERDKDFEDILTILEKEKQFDWQYLIDEAIWQHNNGDSWMLLDIEKTLTELKKYILIPEKYFKQLYAAK